MERLGREAGISDTTGGNQPITQAPRRGKRGSDSALPENEGKSAREILAGFPVR
jgi:hypothetical protein